MTDTRATTHWLSTEELKKYKVKVEKARYVVDGKIISCAGVSAGIDMSLKLAELLTNSRVAQTIQLAIEYDPEPPFSSGSPNKAPKELVELIKSRR